MGKRSQLRVLLSRMFAGALIALALSLQSRPSLSQAALSPLGVFESQADIGSVTPTGILAYDPAAGTYTIAAAGWDLWSEADGFHFVWKKISGDVSLAANMDFPVKTGQHSPSRKAVLMIRQTLDPDSVYVDAAQHGSGMAGLQFRRNKGAITQDIELSTLSPQRLRLEKRGNTFTMFASLRGEPEHQVGASIKLALDGPFYVGLGVSGHDTKAAETAVFSNVELKVPPPYPRRRSFTVRSRRFESTMNIARRRLLTQRAAPSRRPTGPKTAALWSSIRPAQS